MHPHDRLVAALAKRKKSAEFETGISTADRYVSTLTQCVGNQLCERYATTGGEDFGSIMKRASGVLTYNNPDMVTNEIYSDTKAVMSSIPNGEEIETPKNALMVFRHVLTTPRKDRDGDILRTAGARPDPKMLLLWQHVHTMPIGKMLGVVHHDSKKLEVVSAIIDVNELAHDAAVMVDNGMGRFSHGFKAISYVDMKESRGGTTGKPGFDVKEFEILEESLVSVPANIDAGTTEILLDLIEGDKLTSSMMKAYGKTLRQRKTSTTVSGGMPDHVKKCQGDSSCGCGCSKSKPDTGDGNESERSSSEKAKRDAAKAPGEDSESDEGMMCPECEIPLEDGYCPECGWSPEEGEDDEDETSYEKPLKKGPKKKDFLGTESKMFYDTSGIAGSFESVQSQLRMKADEYFQLKGIMSALDKPFPRYAGLVATFPSSAIFEVNDGTSKKFYKVVWTDSGDTLDLVGEPEEVEIEVSTSVRKKKSLDLLSKAGRAISASNRQKLESVYEGMGEIKAHCSTQTGRKMCDRHRISLKEVISSDLEDFEVPKSVSLVDRFSEILAEASPSEIGRMARTLDVVSKMTSRRSSLKSLVGSFLNIR